MKRLAALALASLAFGAGATQVLVVERTHDGPVERAGDVYAWRLSGGLMYLEFGDRSADGIFRNGFEGAPGHVPPVLPCLPVGGEACP